MAELRFHANGSRAAAVKRSLENGRTQAHADARDDRAAKIVELRKQGMSLRAVGLRFRLSHTRVAEILAAVELADQEEARQKSGGRIHGDTADRWLRDNDPAYASRDGDLRRGVKRLPPDLRKTA